MSHISILNLNVVTDIEETIYFNLLETYYYRNPPFLTNKVKLITLICVYFSCARFCCHVSFMYFHLNITSSG